MFSLKLFFLGSPQIERDGAPIEVESRKGTALLAYLTVAAPSRSYSRDALGALLWPEHDQRQARSYVRHTLWLLKKTLGEAWFEIGREQVSLNHTADLWLDVAEFHRQLAAATTHGHPAYEVCADCLAPLTEGVTLYREDFLAGFTLPDAPDFDEWQFFQTESLRRELAGALERLVRGHSAQGEFDLAIPYARRWLALDSLHEPAHRSLMELYARAGQQAAALRQYQECVRILEEELGTPPQAETTALYERIRYGLEWERQLFAQRFIIVDPQKNLLGQGGMGEVYRGTDTQTGEPVAIKVLKPELMAGHPDLVARFVREGEALRQLNHPNIVKMLAATEKGGRHYLIMEYVGGGSLAELLQEQGPLPVSRALEIALGLADALTRAHTLNIIHRDLKPANVLLAEDGTPRLTDFGLARLVDNPPMTQSGVVMGTVDYLSPEACQGESLDARTDIWSFGVLLYEMLTGERPFSGSTVTATLTAILTQSVPDLKRQRPEIPDALANLIYRMLEKDPRRRSPSVRLVGAELEAMLQGREMSRGAEGQGSRGEISPSAPLPPFLFASSPPVTPAPFVAREQELAELATTLETARAGQGQILFVIGGAGRGKTMLVQEFARQAQAANAELVVVSGNCNAHTGLGDPYLPFREALTMLTGEVEARWAAGLITRQHAQGLWEVMPLTLPALVEHAPDLIESFVPGQALLHRAATFATEETPWFKRLATLVTEAGQARLEQPRLFAQYTAVLKAIARQGPLLLVLEDLHWVDTSSSALLFHLSREVGDSRILIAGTYRPEEVALSRGTEQHPLAGIVRELKRQHGDIWLDLGDLAPFEGRQFVEDYLDTQPNQLGAAFREALFRHTGGHALFTVELIREMQERGDLRQDKDGYWVESAAIDWQKLPARVDGVIETRLARLEAELQAILTIASVEGEIFTAEVVARVQQVQERELVQRLSRELDKQHRLVTAQALARLNGQRLSLYRFRHHLFQHYLYHHLDEMERAYLHEAVGTVVEALYGDQTEPVAVQLARHFEQAGLPEKAVTYLLQAGKRASQLSAYEEAIAHLTKGLALLATLPDTSERAQQELNLQITLGNALVAIKGYAAPEVGQTFSRARELCQHADAGETPQLFPVLHGLHRFYLVRAELQTARELGEQILRLAQGQQDPTLLVSAHRVMGATLLFLGEFGPALAHFEQGAALYNPQQHRAYVLLHGQDEGVACLSYVAWALWFLGYPDQALKRSHETLTLAQKLSHPHSLVYALSYMARFHEFRREGQAAQERAEAVITLSNEQGFGFWLALGTVLRGWALAEQGRVEEGIEHLRQGLDIWQATGAGLAGNFFAMLAEAYGKVGQIEEGLTMLARELVAVDKTEERWLEAEAYRFKGGLLLKDEGGRQKDENKVKAEACFLKAIEVARRQGAKSLELRATVSLGRLWQSEGKKQEARRMLAEIYGWFTEGFDTVDLREAKALLEALV